MAKDVRGHHNHGYLVENFREQNGRCIVEEYLHDLNRSFIPYAASFAHHGLLNDVGLWYYGSLLLLRNFNLSSVPAEHLASLVSLVNDCILVWNVSGLGLVTILDNIKCGCLLRMYSQSLDSKETEALVRAVESRGVKVILDDDVTIDIKTLSSKSVFLDRSRKYCKVTKSNCKLFKFFDYLTYGCGLFFLSMHVYSYSILVKLQEWS